MAIDIDELKSAIENTENDTEFKPIQDLIQGMVKTAVSTVEDKLTSKNKEILGEKKKLQERLESSPTEDELKELKEFKEKLSSNREAQLIAEGKIEDVINSRTEQMRLDFERKNKTIQEELESSKALTDTLNSSFTDYKIEDAVVKAAAKEGVLPTAINDVIARSRGIFTLDDKTGEVIARDENNQPLTFEGENMTPSVYMKSIRESAAHLWPASKGANLGGDTKPSDESLVKSSSGDVASYMAHRRKLMAGQSK